MSTSDYEILMGKMRELGITFQELTHPPVFTVDEARRAAENFPPFGHCKNLFLKDNKNRLWLVTALALTQIPLKKLAQKLRAPGLRFAGPEALFKHLHVAPGSVTPLGLLFDTNHVVRVVFDQALFKQETIGFHPLHNAATWLISPNDLNKFVASCGNPDVTIDFETELGLP